MGSLIVALGFSLWMLFQSLVSGSIQGAVSIQIKGKAAPQGTAGTSSISSLSTTITGGAQINLGYGTTSGNVNLIVCQDRTLAASANETLNLNSGALLDIFGAAAAFAHLKYIAVYVVANGDVSGLTVESGASDGFAGFGINTTGTTIYPSGPGMQAGEPSAGIACGSTLCNIKFANNSTTNPVTYRIVLGGTNV